ncbi:ATP-binding protein [Streptomyces sp. NRRL F-5126]|uniref:ATP-binding protein n=1 Tax=Streptomyces sp. NRRL F-5126 TaxID=1463857 RepID=UPI000B28B4BF|nr:tetratricopeptide repeat protein [Streptomyces sp. NRRL F-5126]
MRRLAAHLSGDREPFVVPVYVIAGTAGSGKTALALRWAHLVRENYPDGHLYVNLRGYDPGEPVAAEKVLPRFLMALGVPAAAVPSDSESAAALYRSVLADRRVLVVLDNAATVAQVRPLLPGDGSCLAIVTSRGRLSGLAVRDGAYRLTLGTLPEAEAIALLRTVTDGARADGDDRLAELARLCACLPLALRIAAERATDHPYMPIQELMDELRDESRLWDALSTGDEEGEAVRAVFAWSYRALSPEAARLFRVLGLHPGPEFGVGAAAALAGLSVRTARQQLDVLAGAHLLMPTAPDRFEFHDLLRAYATDRVRQEELPEDRSAALLRLLDWYLHTADAAQAMVMPAEDRLPLGPPNTGVEPLSFADHHQAVDWAERERANFLPVVQAAEKSGLDRYAWQLPAVLWNAKSPSLLATDWLAMGRIGLGAARRLEDLTAEAGLLESHGFAWTKTGRTTEALDSHQRALAIRRQLRDTEGEAASLNAVGLVHLRRRELSPAGARLREAADLFGELGETHWHAVATANLGLVDYEAGRLTEAAEEISLALAEHRTEGAERSIGNALWVLSRIRLDRGQHQQALLDAQEAVRIALDLRSHVLEGNWLLALGDAQRALGSYEEALTSYHRSATLHRRLGDHSREALGLQGTGETYQCLDRTEEAAHFHRTAAAAHRELGDAWNEALALDGLARAVRAGDPAMAHGYWTESLRLLCRYDDPRARATRRDVERRLGDVETGG